MLHHRIDRRRVADVDRVGAHASAVPGHQFLGGLLQYRTPPAREPELRAELQVFAGDFLAEAGAAAGDEDALTFKETVLEHARSAKGERKF